MTSLPGKRLRRRQAVAGVCATLTLLAAACTNKSDAAGTTERSYPPVNPSVFGSYVGPTDPDPPRSTETTGAPDGSSGGVASAPPSTGHPEPGPNSATPRSSSAPHSNRAGSKPPSTAAKPSGKPNPPTGSSLDGPPPSAADVTTTGPGGAEVVLAAPEGPISDSEAKNRREIETAWLNTWRTYEIMHTIPASAIDREFAKSAYGPALEEYIQTAKEAAAYGIRNTGTARHRLWWEPPVGKSDVALILDCVDSRNFGWYDEQLKKRGGSSEADRFKEYEVSAFRDNGSWKVSKVVVTKNKCSY